jgi:ubiquinone/menaquinone biosynthesis C-methylase UbiE
MKEIAWNSKGYRRFDDGQAQEYGTIANDLFAPIYPVIAQMMIERLGVDQGLCIDVGAGPANLAIAIAGITSFHLYAMDFAPQINRFARENISSRGLASRIVPVTGDVHRMPFKDGVASVVVSRGSVRFWRNKPAAFREIARVLKDGGRGVVGGGMGSAKLAEEISREMSEKGAHWNQKPGNRSRKASQSHWKEIMEKSPFSRYEIINDDTGSWVYFEKGTAS